MSPRAVSIRQPGTDHELLPDGDQLERDLDASLSLGGITRGMSALSRARSLLHASNERRAEIDWVRRSVNPALVEEAIAREREHAAEDTRPRPDQPPCSVAVACAWG